MTERTRPAHIAAALNDPAAGALVAGLLRGNAYQWSNEADLQAALAEVLDRFEVYPEREAWLSDTVSRVDFLAGGVAIEVKVRGSWTDVARQLLRYAKCPEVVSIVLVTTRARHGAVPELVHGKPVTVVWLGADAL